MLPLRARVGSGSDGNEGLLHIPQSSSITGTSASDCLVSHLGHSSVGGSYPSVAPTDWAKNKNCCSSWNFNYDTDQKVNKNIKDNTNYNERKGKAGQISRTCQKLKKLLNMKVTVIPIIDGALWTLFKKLDMRLDGLEICGKTKTMFYIYKT